MTAGHFRKSHHRRFYLPTQKTLLCLSPEPPQDVSFHTILKPPLSAPHNPTLSLLDEMPLCPVTNWHSLSPQMKRTRYQIHLQTKNSQHWFLLSLTQTARPSQGRERSPPAHLLRYMNMPCLGYFTLSLSLCTEPPLFKSRDSTYLNRKGLAEKYRLRTHITSTLICSKYQFQDTLHSFPLQWYIQAP